MAPKSLLALQIPQSLPLAIQLENLLQKLDLEL